MFIFYILSHRIYIQQVYLNIAVREARLSFLFDTEVLIECCYHLEPRIELS